MTKTVIRTTAATTRTIQIRSIWKMVPSKRIAGGKKSAIVGAWKPPSLSDAARSAGVASVDRMDSQWSCGPGSRHPWVGTPSDLAVMDSPVA
jgi:hypothetical protein